MHRVKNVSINPQKEVPASLGDLDNSPSVNDSFDTSILCLDQEDLIRQSQRGKVRSQTHTKGARSLCSSPFEPTRPIQSLAEFKEKPIRQANPPKKHTTQDRISQVQNDSLVVNCIYSACQDLNKGVNELQTNNDRFYSNMQTNYKVLDDGSIEMINKDLLKKQKQVLGYLVKQFGSMILSGKSIMSISLPVGVFEPRSLLERLAESFVFAPYFLERGGQTTDPLEQFKQAFTFYLTTLMADLNPEKPFNPILGETFQGIIGGCPVYIEQISHHPPIAAFQMLGKGFVMEGTFEFHAAISTNSVKCRKTGEFKVKYKNTGAEIQVQFPMGYMSGTAFGKRTFQHLKKLQVYDFGNSYYCEIDFEKSESSKKRKEVPGYFSSYIYKVNEKFKNKAKQEMQKAKDCEIKFKEKDHAVAQVEKVEGSWLEILMINNKTYWSRCNPMPYKLQNFDNPLPSDSTLRLDVLYLKARDELKAQDKKVMLEELQRKDRKLREQVRQKSYR